MSSALQIGATNGHDRDYDDSDADDSISLTSTAPSVQQTEYDVDRILAERQGEGGQPEYLVRWEGYEDHRSTWEPAESFMGSDPLSRWEKEKEEIAAGRRRAFNVTNMERNIRAVQGATQRRKAKRRMKRRKLAQAAKEKGIGKASDTESDHTKKRTAQLTQAKPSASTAHPSGPGLRRKSRPDAIQPPGRNLSRQDPTETQSSERNTVRQDQPATQPFERNTTRQGEPATRPSGRTVSRQDPKKAPKPRAEGKGTSDEDLAEIRGRQPRRPETTIEMQRRRFAPRASPQPDLSQLNFIDPTTGKDAPSVRQHFARRKSTHESSFFNPGTALAGMFAQPETERRDAMDRRHADRANSPDISAPTNSPRPDDNTSVPTNRPRPDAGEPRWHPDGSLRAKFRDPPLTCYFWFNKEIGRHQQSCAKSAEECDFAHWNTGVLADNVSKRALPIADEIKPVTCFFWLRGHRGLGTGCSKTAQQCRFAHSDTGVYKGQPAMNYPHLPAPMSANVPHPLTSMDMDSSRPHAPMGMHTLRPDVPLIPDSIPVYLKLHLPNEVSTVPVQLTGLSQDIKAKMTSFGLRRDATLEIKKMMAVNIYESNHHHKNLDISEVGGVFPMGSSGPKLKTLANFLQLNYCCYLFAGRDFTLMVFPGRDLVTGLDPWRFMGSPMESSDAILRVHVRSAIKESEWSKYTVPAGHVASQSAKAAERTLELGEKLFKKPVADFFHWSGEEPVEKNVFLFSHGEAHRRELEVVTRIFHAYGADVYHMGAEGSWDYWTSHVKSGIVLFQAQITSFLPLIPNITSLIVDQASGKKFNFYEVGRNLFPQTYPDGYKPENANDGKLYTTRHLFPIGDVFLILDEVIQDQPAKAVKLLDAFLTRQSRLPHFFRQFFKIAARPEVSDWTMKLANKYQDEWKKEQRGERIKLYDRIDNLIGDPRKNAHPKYHGEPVWDSGAYLISPRTCPMSKQDNGMEVSEEWDDNPMNATDYRVYWFGQFALMKCQNFRRFVVILGEKYQMMEKWRKLFGHLEFLTPEEAIEKYLRRPDQALLNPGKPLPQEKGKGKGKEKA